MALIACSECGRAVSSKAEVCVGCGAPLATMSSIELVAKHSNAPPLTRDQIKRRALQSLSMFALGVVSAGFVDHRHGGQLASFVAALLIIIGLCGFLTTFVHAVFSRR
jgi:hypothetical protein